MDFTARASDTSSITAPRIAATPPARSSASRRTSEQPPAAAAVRAPGRLLQRNGYSWAKKYTKAGTISRSQPVATRSRAICDTRSRPLASAAATSSASESGPCAMSASVSSRYSTSGPASSTPCRSAHSLPVQPGGSGGGLVTVSSSPSIARSSAASAPVPSELWSSTRITRARPGYFCPSSVGRLTGSTAASSRAGTTIAACGQRTGGRRGGSRTSVRQNKPWQHASQSHTSRENAAIHSRTVTPAVCRRTGPDGRID